MDPTTGLPVHGRFLGRNELLEHRRLARIRQNVGTAVADDDSEASIQAGSHSQSSQSHSTIPKTKKNSDSIPSLKDTASAATELSPEGATYLLLYRCCRSKPANFM
jgi:hypothetical protein